MPYLVSSRFLASRNGPNKHWPAPAVGGAACAENVACPVLLLIAVKVTWTVAALMYRITTAPAAGIATGFPFPSTQAARVAVVVLGAGLAAIVQVFPDPPSQLALPGFHAGGL